MRRNGRRPTPRSPLRTHVALRSATDPAAGASSFFLLKGQKGMAARRKKSVNASLALPLHFSFLPLHMSSYGKAYAVALASLLCGASVVHWAWQPDLVRREGEREERGMEESTLRTDSQLALAFHPFSIHQTIPTTAPPSKKKAPEI